MSASSWDSQLGSLIGCHYRMLAQVDAVGGNHVASLLVKFRIKAIEFDTAFHCLVINAVIVVDEIRRNSVHFESPKKFGVRLKCIQVDVWLVRPGLCLGTTCSSSISYSTHRSLHIAGKPFF